MVDEANNRRWAQVSQHSPSRQASQASQGRSNNQTNHAAAAAALPRSASSNGVRRESVRLGVWVFVAGGSWGGVHLI